MMVQQLRVLAPFLEDLDLIFSIHMEAPATGNSNSMAASGHSGNWHASTGCLVFMT